MANQNQPTEGMLPGLDLSKLIGEAQRDLSGKPYIRVTLHELERAPMVNHDPALKRGTITFDLEMFTSLGVEKLAELQVGLAPVAERIKASRA